MAFWDYWKITLVNGEENTYNHDPSSEWGAAPIGSILERAEGDPDDEDLWYWVELEVKD